MNFNSLYFKGKLYSQNGHNLIARIYRFIIKVYYHCDIPFQTNIDPTVHFCHNAFGVVINPNARIGKNVIIQHRVTIGEVDDSHKAPIILDGAYIGAGAIILGGGNNWKKCANWRRSSCYK